MAESRTSHRLTTPWISRSCVFLTTPWARGFAATYNQHIFMSRSQTPLLNGVSTVPFNPGPGPSHLVFRPLSFYRLFFFFFSVQEEAWGEAEDAKLLDHLGRRRARGQSCLLSQFANLAWSRRSFICILRFFEVKLTRRLPLRTPPYMAFLFLCP